MIILILHSDLYSEMYILSSYVAHSAASVEADAAETLHCKVIA